MIFGRYVNKYYRKYWYLFLILFACDTIVDIVQLMVPKIIGNIINAFTGTVGSTPRSDSPFRVITGFGGYFTMPSDTVSFFESDFFLTILAVAIIGFTIFVGRIGWRYFSATIGAHVERDLRKEMFTHIQTMSLSYYHDKKVGGLLSFFTNDLTTIKMCFSDVLIWETDLIVLGTSSIILMLMMSYEVTLLTAIPLVLFIVFGGIVGKQETNRYKISSDAFEDLSDFTEENLQGFSVIKSFQKEKDRVKRFHSLSAKAKDTSISYLKFSSMIDSGIQFFLSITFAILFILCGISILDTTGMIAGNIRGIGDVTTFVGYYDALIWPMIAGGMLIDYTSRGMGAQKRIGEILDAKPDIVDDDNAKRDHLDGDVKFNHLTFRYSDSEIDCLKDISFHVTPGMTVGIIGRTGCGKSTLVSLLPKLYNLPRGMLLIDDVDINDWRKADLRTQIGYVLQEGFLFAGSVKENIALSEDKPHVCDMDKVIRSCQFADVDNDIQAFAQGYDTIVGEKGSTVSGGQRQRMCIARAFYKDPKMLILDDSLSAVDADTEKKILANIKNDERKLTTFVIAHRVSAIENADLILVMDQGELVGIGKHEDLLSSCKLYHDIVELQRLEKEVN